MIESLEEVLETNELEYEYTSKTDDAVNAEEIAIQGPCPLRSQGAAYQGSLREMKVDTLEEYKRNKLRLKAEREELMADAGKTPQAGLNSLLPRFQARKISCARLHMCMRFWQTQNISYEIKGNALRKIVKEIVFDRGKGHLHIHFIYHRLLQSGPPY